MRKLLTVAAGLVVALAVSNVWAGMILNVDAAALGANPSTQWNDLSSSGYNLTNNGATYSAATKSYVFNGTSSYLEGSGAGNAFFNFETEKAGVGLGTPFSVVMYYNQANGSNSNGGNVLLSNSGGNDRGWMIGPRSDAANGGPWGDGVGRLDTHLINFSYNGGYPSPTESEAFQRGSPYTASGWTLAMITYDGSGTVAGIKEYIDGSTMPLAVGASTNDLTGTIQNTVAAPLDIGRDPNPAYGSHYQGSLGFVEIWTGALDASYSASRWNGGDPLRASASPEPGTLVLLGTGLMGLLAYAWRKRK